MNARKSLSMFAAAFVLTASVATLASATDPYASLPLPYGDLLSRSDSTSVDALEASVIDDPDMTAQGALAEQQQILEGQVAAVDESGSLMLRTGDGLIALQLAPEDVQGVGVGDTMQVALMESE